MVLQFLEDRVEDAVVVGCGVGILVGPSVAVDVDEHDRLVFANV